jgi:signal transduction histidine kinase
MDESVLLLGACMLLALVCAILTVKMTAGIFRRMEWQTGELSRVSWHLLEGQESAARRFSHELHDELGQSLTAIKANLASIAASGGERARVEDCLHLVDEAIQNVRELSHLLRPIILDDFGLDAGLRWLAEKFTHRTGIDVEYVSNFTGRLQDETETHVFRIAQEALTNIARHSEATHVRMELKADAGAVRLCIGDNGKGLAGAGRPGGMGMIGMRARARSAGGEVAVKSEPGHGVQIDVWVPAPAPQQRNVEDPHPVGR